MINILEETLRTEQMNPATLEEINSYLQRMANIETGMKQ